MTRAFLVSGEGMTLEAVAVPMGADLLVAVTGGEKPHIGAASVSVPRPSLKDPAKTSSTTSTVNIIGHKDNAVGDRVSARLSAALGTTVVVACGIHIDGIDAEGIGQVVALAEKLTDELIEAYKT